MDSPNELLKTNLEGYVDYYKGGKIAGWLNKNLIEKDESFKLIVNGRELLDISLNQPRPDLADVGISKDNDFGFKCKIQPHQLLSKNFENSLIIARPDGSKVAGIQEVLLPEPNIKYNIDTIDEHFVHGWIVDQSYAEVSLKIDVYSNNKKIDVFEANLERQDLLSAGYTYCHCGFAWEYNGVIDSLAFNEVDFYISDTNIKINEMPVIIDSVGAKLACLNLLSQRIRNNQLDFTDAKKGWLIHDVIPKIASELRHNKNSFTYTAHKTNKPETQPVSIDVIIPVYDGYDETLACLKSALNATCSVRHNVIVIDDCSPNPALSEELKRLSETENFKLYANEHNLGFVKTVNRGMKLSESHDVVLLNADTIVPDKWLDQLSATAYQNPLFGTVTPLSNNATICSYPGFCIDNKLEAGRDVNYYNELMSSVNGTSVVELPTAHGFCMYIKREVLSEVGYFDEKKWGMGYGEENDFSLRAQQAGWKNIAAAGTYVQHVGSVSFASNADDFIEKNLKKLNGLYPEYAANVHSFITTDPLRYYRNKAAKVELLKKLEAEVAVPAETFLFVSLTIGGGTTIATDAIQEMIVADDVRSLYLTSPSVGIWRISHRNVTAYIDFVVKEELEEFIEFISQLGVTKIQYHHVIQFDDLVRDLPRLLGIPYDITLHDYYHVCPRVNLIDETGTYCGEPPESSCNKCLTINGLHPAMRSEAITSTIDIVDWREQSEIFLEQAENVFAPSKDTADRITKYFKTIDVKVRYHPEPVKWVENVDSDGDLIRVAVLGAIGQHKGYDRLISAVKYAEKFELPIEFHLIGYSMNDAALNVYSNLKIFGQYNRHELPAILKDLNCSASLLLSVWPETFSYTYSESLENGLTTIALDHGAIPERNENDAIIISANSFGKEICDAILESKGKKWSRSIGTEYSNALESYYV